MSDLISRQAVLTLFEKRFLELQIAKRLPENKVQEYEQGGVNWCINTVRDIPSAENKEEQNIAIKFCHDHKLLMIPVDHYHMLNVAYNAYMNNMTYEEAEKLLLEEVRPNE